jgi:hypothetical protein
METLPVIPIGGHPAIRYAAEELVRCLDAAGIAARVTDAGAPVAAPGIRLGVAQDLGASGAALPALPEPSLDDAVLVAVEGGVGTIAGTNPRSVLLAVYRFLTELGFRWVRPGLQGEIVPRLHRAALAASVREAASYRHRGICIEGAVSFEHVRDLIDWMPKVGLNAYFIQFRESFVFFDRWYAHRDNPRAAGPGKGIADVRAMVRDIEAEIAKRDLLYHAVGHGWTCEPFGVPGLGWDRYEGPVPEEARRAFALVDGKRELWQGIPLNTNLCYGTPEVRRTIVTDVVRYAKDRPEIRYLHLWLADGTNNHCECEACVKARPADFYVMLLNELDEALGRAGLDTRIVFLVYVDLYWPPEREVIRNADRFVLMFAPITRTYSRSFSTPRELPALAPYTRNRLQFPKSIEENLAHLRAWQGRFPGDSFDFDYHLIWDHFCDPGYTAVAQGLHEDLVQLRSIGLNGFVSCQVQRAFFPTGLAMAVLGQTLWNRDARFDEIADDYYRSAFGHDGPACRAYLASLSDAFDPPYLRGERPAVDPERVRALERVTGIVDRFLPVIRRNSASSDPCHAASWRYLLDHAEICRMLASAIAALASGRDEEARDRADTLMRYLWEREPELHRVLDVWMYQQVIRTRLGMKVG